MNFSIKTSVVDNKDKVIETRLDKKLPLDLEIPVDCLVDALTDSITNYSEQAFDWYNTVIKTSITFNNIEILAIIDYSFSSQYATLVIREDNETIDTASFENNQMDYEWNPSTVAEEFLFDFEDTIEEALDIHMKL